MTDDPLFDYYRNMDEQEEALERLPICEYCEERIQDEFFYLIGDEIICERCLNEQFRKDVEDYAD